MRATATSRLRTRSSVLCCKPWRSDSDNQFCPARRKRHLMCKNLDIHQVAVALTVLPYSGRVGVTTLRLNPIEKPGHVFRGADIRDCHRQESLLRIPIVALRSIVDPKKPEGIEVVHP